jgi:ankyrin repeat protein
VPIDDLFDIQLDPSARPRLATPLMVAVGSADGATAATVDLLLALGASPVGTLEYACGLGWNYLAAGDAARLASLLRAGADPNEGNPLAAAARIGDPHRLRILLEAGATPEPAGMHSSWQSPIQQAAKSGTLECVGLLLDAGASADPVFSTYEDTPILTVAASLDVFRAFLDAGARVAAELPHGRTIVREVAENTRVSVADRVTMLSLLQTVGVDVNEHEDGGTALARAAMNGNADAVETLLTVGADPRVGGNPLGSACFSFSAGRDAEIERTIKLLVSAGIDKDETDTQGFRPIHAAVSDDRYGPGFAESDGINVAAIAALTELGADVDAPFPDNGWRPLHAAAAQGRTKAVRILLDAGCDPRQRTPGGRSPLDLARAAAKAFAAPPRRDAEDDERFVELIARGTTRDRAERQMEAIREAQRRDWAARLPDALKCVELLESRADTAT